MTVETGNAEAQADLTPSGGTSEDSSGLTEQTVQGLSRTVTRLKQQIAALSASSASSDPKDVETLKKELGSTSAENKRLKIALKYPDVSDFLTKAMEKQKLDPDLIDDEFVAVIREGQKKTSPEETVEVGHNPVRGQQSQDQQDEATLRQMTSLFKN
jgi:hypothetical protein